MKQCLISITNGASSNKDRFTIKTTIYEKTKKIAVSDVRKCKEYEEQTTFDGTADKRRKTAVEMPRHPWEWKKQKM